MPSDRMRGQEGDKKGRTGREGKARKGRGRSIKHRDQAKKECGNM